MALRFLVIDDDAADQREFSRLLLKIFSDSTILSADEGVTAADVGEPPDVALVDFGLVGITGIELMEELRASWPSTAFIITTGQGDEEIARDSIKRGAADYIPKAKIATEPLRRMIENALAMSDMRRRLQEQQRDLEVFADVMVHDFKSPIRTVRFLLDELKIGLEANDAQAIDNMTRLLDRAAERMGALVDSLACHAMTTKDLPFEIASLREAIDVSLIALTPLIAAESAVVHVHVDDVRLLCSPPQLSQLFQNVIGNSIKYAGGNRPEIYVSAQTDEPGHILISVADNGIGIPKEFRERAFEPFKRAPGAANVAGTGLGLATCRKVAERHGGRIWCDPETESGTMIHVRLPLERGRSQLPSRA